MKNLTTRGVKILKICHLIFVMIWVVGVIAMALISFLKAQSGDELFMTLYITRIIDDFLVIPGAVLTVITAIVYGTYTNWGFFKHRWIIVKWIVSILVIIVGTFYFSPILDDCLNIADQTRDAALNNPIIISNIHITSIGACIQASMLIILVVISVLKPWKTKKSN